MKAQRQLKVRRDFRIDPKLDQVLTKFAAALRRTKTSIVEEALRNLINKVK